MGLTELLMLISILVIVAIVLRVIVAAMNSRKNKIKIALEKNIPEYDLDEADLVILTKLQAVDMAQRARRHMVALTATLPCERGHSPAKAQQEDQAQQRRVRGRP